MSRAPFSHLQFSLPVRETCTSSIALTYLDTIVLSQSSSLPYPLRTSSSSELLLTSHFDQERVNPNLNSLNNHLCATQHPANMTEESNPATSSVPPASSDTQMDTSQTGIDSKQDDATVNENAAVGTKKDEEHQEATEGDQSFGADSIHSYRS